MALPLGRAAKRAPPDDIHGNADLGRDRGRHRLVAFVRLRRSAATEGSGIWRAILNNDSIYLEVAAGVTVFVLAGRYFEARAKSKAGSALRALAELGAKNVAVLLPDGAELVIPASELKKRQRFVTRPGKPSQLTESLSTAARRSI